ncbi:MAG: alpha-L-fucosidase [Phycisphaerae bacterium]|nr:alpha-L-fucosidase [Phycisphaerae bacterium]
MRSDKFLVCGFLILTAAFAGLGVSKAGGQTVRYSPEWDSLDARPTPAWFGDAKFGIFIHWGVYSVPAWAPIEGVGVYARYSEWYWRRWREKGEGHDQFVAFHTKAYGDKVHYQDFVKDFTCEMYEPDYWAEVFERAGAKYVVLTSKHHDGFCLWPSGQSWNWNSVDVGPHRDLAGELTEAVRKRGLRMGFYYSLYEWYHPLYRSDVPAYVDTHMLPQVKDLVMRYKPDIVWSDGEWDHPDEVWKSREFLAWLYNESPVKDTVAVNDRWGKGTRSKHGGYYTTEYSQEKLAEEGTDHPWEECRGIGHSFGYNRNERLGHYTSAEKLVHMLVDLVSKGGNLLLDIGPTADGRIPVIMEQRLTEMGDWLKVNGEAIYGTRKWDRAGKDNGALRFTQKGNTIYAVSLGWPGDEMKLDVPKPAAGAQVVLVGRDGKLPWTYKQGRMCVDTSGVKINELPCRHAYAFRISGAY